MFKNKIILLIVFISFSFSCLLSINNIYKYDKNIKNIDNNTYYHQMIKFDTLRFMSGGEKIKDQLKNGISFFATGDENFTKYLLSIQSKGSHKTLIKLIKGSKKERHFK
jgi:hypothetical protein